MKMQSLILTISTTLMVAGCSAHDHSATTVELSDCAIQQTIPGAKATGAFLTLHKHGSDALSVVSAAVPSVTAHVELHEMVMKDGTMKMQEIQAYPLQEGDNVFKKGSYHVMLMDLDKTLSVGETHPLTLNFSDGSSQTCTAEVKSVEALTPKGMKMHQHGDDKMHHHN